MLVDLKPIFAKVLVILIIVLVYFTITKYSNIELFEEISEPFENTINNEKTNYLKLKETYIKPNTKTLDILYSNRVNNEENEENEETEETEEKALVSETIESFNPRVFIEDNM